LCPNLLEMCQWKEKSTIFGETCWFIGAERKWSNGRRLSFKIILKITSCHPLFNTWMGKSTAKMWNLPHLKVFAVREEHVKKSKCVFFEKGCGVPQMSATYSFRFMHSAQSNLQTYASGGCLGSSQLFASMLMRRRNSFVQNTWWKRDTLLFWTISILASIYGYGIYLSTEM